MDIIKKNEFKHIHEGIILTWFIVVSKIIILISNLVNAKDLTSSLTGSNIDLAITCVFLHFMYKKSTISFVCMLVFFVCNQLIKMTDQPAYIIILMMGMFIYARAIASCYYFNSGKNISLLLKFTNFIFFFLFVTLNIVSVRLCFEGASSQTIKVGHTLNRIKKETLLRNRIIDDTNNIVYFYSPNEYISEGGVILTNKKLLIYNLINDSNYLIDSVNYEDVVKVEFVEIIKDKALYDVYTTNSSMYRMWLPADLIQSEVILGFIRNPREI